MLTAITSLLDFLKNLCGLKQTEIENKTTLDVVKDKKSLKKGTNYAEQIFLITDNYIDFFSKQDLRKYNLLKKRFLKNN